MKTTRTRLLVGAVVLTCGAAAIARATTPIGLVLANILSTGTINGETTENVRIDFPKVPGAPEPKEPLEDEWKGSLTTNGPTDIFVLDIEYASGGHTGWHSHPGILLTSMISGSIERYDSQCVKHVYNAGDSFTEDSRPHYVRNVGTDNAHYTTTYILPHGYERRTDQPAPDCAAALGLE